MKKQTAVEWLVEEITNGTLHTKELIKKAIEMEEQQIADAYYNGCIDMKKAKESLQNMKP